MRCKGYIYVPRRKKWEMRIKFWAWNLTWAKPYGGPSEWIHSRAKRNLKDKIGMNWLKLVADLLCCAVFCNIKRYHMLNRLTLSLPFERAFHFGTLQGWASHFCNLCDTYDLFYIKFIYCCLYTVTHIRVNWACRMHDKNKGRCTWSRTTW
jgi:hypothetical protein